MFDEFSTILLSRIISFRNDGSIFQPSQQLWSHIYKVFKGNSSTKNFLKFFRNCRIKSTLFNSFDLYLTRKSIV